MRRLATAALVLILAPAAAVACPSDCDGNGSVTAAEVDAAVQVLLEKAALATCSAADFDANGTVRCREVVRGVRALTRGCPAPSTSLAGVVSDVDDGTPLYGVAVSLAGLSASTDVNGVFSFDGVSGGPQVLTFRRDGYATTYETLEAAANAAPYPVGMKKVGETFPVDGAVGGRFSTPGAVVTITANSLQAGDGSPVTGEAVLEVTKFDAGTGDIMAFPGEFEGQAAGGGTTTIESFGFATFELTAGGQPVNLVPGSSAKIEFLLPENAQSEFTVGQQVGLWEFDEETGTWLESSVPGTIQESTQVGGKLAWVADVPHFSTWNCDRPVTEKHCLSGQVVVDGVPVAGALVSAVGVSYNGVSNATTGTDGRWCVDVKRNETVEIQVRLNGAATPLATRTVTVPDVQASCGTGGCTEVAPPLSVSFDACVRGHVLDPSGEPVADSTVFVVPGEIATTDANGEYCARAPAGMDVTVFGYGQLSVRVETPASGACPDAGCAVANLTLALPTEGGFLGGANISSSRSIYPNFQNPNQMVTNDSISADGVFLLMSSLGQPGTTTTIEQVGNCTVMTSVTVFDQGQPPQPFSYLPLDPGNPGTVMSGAAETSLWRGNPLEYEPPNPTVLGVFSPPAEVDLASLGFAADTNVTFSWPGGADIGSFSDSVYLPPRPVVTSPDLMSASLSITPGAPFPATWTPAPVGGLTMEVMLSTTRQGFDIPTQTFTIRTVTIWCAFPDQDGAGTLAADLTASLLSGGDVSSSVYFQRFATTIVPVSLLRTGGQGEVHLMGRSSVARTISFGGPTGGP